MKEEIDCQYTDEIVCPYCGYENDESWEYYRGLEDYDSYTTVECSECQKEYEVYREFEVHYSSYCKKVD